MQKGSGIRNSAIRHKQILEILDKSGAVKVQDLSRLLNTSEVTIRKDLEYLEAQELLTRIHGGAKKKFTAFFDRYNQAMHAEKVRIAKCAADLVEEGDFVAINVGSTCFQICEALKLHKNITVLTNSVSHLKTLIGTPGIRVLFLGGFIDNDMQITVGNDLIEQMSKYTADKLFLGMDGIDIENGATTYNYVEESIIRCMLGHAKQKILVADDSKIGKTTFARVAQLEEFDTIITTYNETKMPIIEQIQKRGIKVLFA